MIKKGAAIRCRSPLLTMDKRKLLNDVILIAVLLCTALLAWGLIKLLQKDGNYAVVTVEGELYGEYPLDEDTEVMIVSSDGHINVLVISNGKAMMTEADCPDKLCVKHAPISKGGQTIVCLPHKLVVRIVSDTKEGVDASL